MRRIPVVLALVFVAAAVPRSALAQKPKTDVKQPPTAAVALTPEARAEIEKSVREVMEGEFAAIREVNMEAFMATSSKEPGLCLFNMNASLCSKVWEAFRKAWSPDNPNRGLRQEFDSQEIRVMALSPTVAVATSTIQEGRYYPKNGEVSRARYALFAVYVFEDGQWRWHSGQQAAWPITQPNADTKGAPSAAEAAAVRELTDLEQSWAAAYLKKDAGVVERLLADDYVSTSARGVMGSKAEELSAVASVKYDALTMDDIKVHVYGETAVVTGRNTQKGSFNGRDISGVFRWTDTWVKRNGKWQAVASQLVKVAEQ